MSASQVLQLLAAHVKEDRDFRPVNALSTRRVHVSAAGTEWELLIDGPKFYDTRARAGGGGAVDLVMHIWKVPFRRAVTMLRNAGE